VKERDIVLELAVFDWVVLLSECVLIRGYWSLSLGDVAGVEKYRRAGSFVVALSDWSYALR
jgi:hypothetical protein